MTTVQPAAQAASRKWWWSFGYITVTEDTLRVDAIGRHDNVKRSDITNINRTFAFPRYSNLRIGTRSGSIVLLYVRTRSAKEILTALGF